MFELLRPRVSQPWFAPALLPNYLPNPFQFSIQPLCAQVAGSMDPQPQYKMAEDCLETKILCRSPNPERSHCMKGPEPTEDSGDSQSASPLCTFTPPPPFCNLPTNVVTVPPHGGGDGHEVTVPPLGLQHGQVAVSAFGSGRACPTAVVAFCPFVPPRGGGGLHHKTVS